MWLATLAHADALQDKFDTVWESLWHQGGVPISVVRWGVEIRVNIHGRNESMYRGRVMAALQKVTGLAGVRLVDVSQAPNAVAIANLDVQIVDNRNLQDNQACYVQFLRISLGRIEKMELKMRDNAVYYCVLHESMHAIGISGHPTGDTVLSYFYQRSDALTDMDELMVRTWYGPEMRTLMTPFQAVVVLTDAVVKAYGQDTQKARDAQQRFLADTLGKMEAFAGEQGEVPAILKRSGTASGEAIARGRVLMRYYLGQAYEHGEIATADLPAGTRWMARSAADGFAPAQMAMGRAYEEGVGVAFSASDAYVWYSLAAAQEMPDAAQALQRVASVMSPQEVDAAKARLPAPG